LGAFTACPQALQTGSSVAHLITRLCREVKPHPREQRQFASPLRRNNCGCRIGECRLLSLLGGGALRLGRGDVELDAEPPALQDVLVKLVAGRQGVLAGPETLAGGDVAAGEAKVQGGKNHLVLSGEHLADGHFFEAHVSLS
jgi:hypothetical protein